MRDRQRIAGCHIEVGSGKPPLALETLWICHKSAVAIGGGGEKRKKEKRKKRLELQNSTRVQTFVK